MNIKFAIEIGSRFIFKRIHCYRQTKSIRYSKINHIAAVNLSEADEKYTEYCNHLPQTHSLLSIFSVGNSQSIDSIIIIIVFEWWMKMLKCKSIDFCINISIEMKNFQNLHKIFNFCCTKFHNWLLSFKKRIFFQIVRSFSSVFCHRRRQRWQKSHFEYFSLCNLDVLMSCVLCIIERLICIRCIPNTKHNTHIHSIEELFFFPSFSCSFRWSLFLNYKLYGRRIQNVHQYRRLESCRT